MKKHRVSQLTFACVTVIAWVNDQLAVGLTLVLLKAPMQLQKNIKFSYFQQVISTIHTRFTGASL
ncbi:hypothetical protein [Pleionea mediterranea]|jgi:hypothetical protein|uniref:Uncharacterized protein n=1 Tax=Pleionea mediterranea TaxID=523701 RepID=A0A316FLW1_9GAMM|nr:hypothetical protein [Pleionea mediterranea]PWK49878.1 hypothetical protein C8D97_10739 [Pleionea mediterranea]